MTIEEQIALIDRNVDMVDYISQYTDFRQKGREYWALSPLTNERTPSFSVNTERSDRHVFKDFSSGASGDIVDFVKVYEGVGTKEAIKILSRYAAIDESELTRKTHLDSAVVAKRYQKKDSKRKHNGHKVLSNSYMDRFVWNDDKLQLWRDEGITDETMRVFEVRYDPLSNRIVFPLKDNSGNIINVIGRTTDTAFKQKGLRKYTYFFPLGNLDMLYGFSEARDEIAAKGEIVLFESAKSVMMCYGWGIRNTCAILTSHLNDDQYKLLIRLGRPVVFALDKDANPFADKNIKKLRRYCNVSVIVDQEGVLDEKDSPADKGEEAFRKLYEERIEW